MSPKTLLAVAVLLGAESSCFAQPPKPMATWKLIGNDLPRAGYCTAELTLEPSVVDANINGESTLYFNFARKPAADINQPPRRPPTHINGDLFSWKIPTTTKNNEAARFQAVFEGAVRHVTDAPAGFFIVATHAGNVETVTPIVVDIDLSVLRDDQKPTVEPPLDERSSSLARESAASEPLSAPWIPQPQQYEHRSGVVNLKGLPIECSADQAIAAQLISDAIVSAGGNAPGIKQIIDASLPAIRLRLSEITAGDHAVDKQNEAYLLEASTSSGVVITGSDRAGLYYGAQSLAALIANAPAKVGSNDCPAIHELLVRDAPHFRYRGLHLDVARNFQSMATLRKLLDLMAAYKLNRFHLHLTDDEGWRLAIRGLPELTEVGARRGYSPGFREFLPPSFGSGPEPDIAPGSGFYSRDEFIDLLRYADDRHIEVIPEIDLPGHSRAAIQAMHVRSERFLAAGDVKAAQQFRLRRPDDEASYESIQMWNDNVIDVRLDSAIAFVEHVVGDVADMYAEAGVPFKTIHLGGDEVPRGCWGDSQNPILENQTELFASFMDRCAKIARSHGARSAGWEEVFLSEAPLGETLRPGASAGGLCYVWNNIWGWGQEDAAYRLANAGADVVLCNATHLYFDLAYDDSVNEPGYYWAGATDLKEVFHFQPYAYFDSPVRDRTGVLIPDAEKQHMTRLTAEGRRHIVGIQGHLWAENLNSAERLEYMAFPRILALAEIAWVGPADSRGIDMAPSRTWDEFARHLIERELPRLGAMNGGVKFRPASDLTAVIRD